MQQFKAEGVEIPLPPVSADYLRSIFLEVGPVIAAGMGPGPITYSEIDAWMRCSGVSLAPWEARGIRDASREYLAQSRLDQVRAADDPQVPPPWSEQDATDALMDTAAARMKRSLRAMARGGR